MSGNDMQIVFSFDTTGSMYGSLEEVRGRVSDMIQRLQADIPGISFAIIAHGDYCDLRTTYITKYIDFTTDIDRLCDFVKNVARTGGGDADECYELVLHEVRTMLSWNPSAQKALVMIGDSNPHGVDYPQNTLKIDWREEAEKLGQRGIRIYSVQCGSNDSADAFYEDIAMRTHGHHLKLDDFKNIFDFLMSVCYKEKGAEFFDSYEKEVRARCGPVNKDLTKLFGDLRDAAPSDTTSDIVTSPETTTTKGKSTKKVTLKTAIKGELPVIKKERKSKTGFKRVRLPKKLLGYTDKNLPILRRENVPESNFMMKGMSWSGWQLAITPSTTDAEFRRRSGCDCGMRTRQIFNGKTTLPALYEVAVQTKCRSRKYVVYNKISRRGFTSGVNWEKKLLGRADIRKQINQVVGKNCNIYIRRVLLKASKDGATIKQNLKRYDYAWKVLKSQRSGHRHVTKTAVNISTDMDTN